MASDIKNNIIGQLSEGKFRSVPLNIVSESIPKRGRKKVIHDYPNSNKRFVQDLGPLPSTFEVEAVVYGSDFLAQATRLESVLELEGDGGLVLPHLGSLTVVALPYSIDYSHKSVGVIRYKLKFTLSNTNEVPAQSLASALEVIRKADRGRELAQEKLASTYKKPIGDISFIKAATDFTSSVATTVENFSSQIIVANDQIQGVVRDIQSDVSSIIVSPQIMAERLIFGNIELANGLFATFSSILTDPTVIADGVNRPSVSKLLENLTFGLAFQDLGTSDSDSEIAVWPSDTADREARNINRRAIVESVRYNTLLLAFEVAASYEYDTTNDITGVTAALEEAYATVMQSDDEDAVLTSDNDLKITMDEVKSLAFDVLEQKLQQSYSVSDYNVGGIQSIFGLTYRLYAEQFRTSEDLQEFAEKLDKLNTGQVPTEYSGSSDVFEVT